MSQRLRLWALFIVASTLGLLIGWVDSRPTWDDTGMTVGAIILVAAALGLAHPARAWVWALLVGGWVPIIGLFQRNNYASLLALGFAFVGAYVGVLGRRVLRSLGSTEPPRFPPH